MTKKSAIDFEEVIMTAWQCLKAYGYMDSTTFDSEFGGPVTVKELREVDWPEALVEEGLSPEEYPFEAYLHDCLAENGGALHLRNL